MPSENFRPWKPDSLAYLPLTASTFQPASGFGSVRDYAFGDLHPHLDRGRTRAAMRHGEHRLEAGQPIVA